MKATFWLKYLHSGFVGILTCLSLGVFAGSSVAEPSNIVPDNTLGGESSRVINDYQGLPVEAITGGATRGINLFHSFREFNVSEGRGAYFLSPNADIQNILSRVTGSNKSEILGTLGTFGESQPNLFLINPNGIVFGENSSLDVEGSFVATTANGVQFASQGNFSATNPQQPSQLLTINPSAFLFNQINQNAGIQNNSVAPAGTDPAGFDIFGLRVPDGKSLLLLGGNVSLDGGRLYANGGRIELGGLAEPGNVNLAVNGNNLSLNFPENLARADVSIKNQAGAVVNGFDGGDIAINTQNLEISENSGLFAGILFGLGTPSSQAGNININATGTFNLTDDSFIYNTLQRTATGKAGDVNINAASVNLESGSVLSVSTYGKGDAGNIFITASDGVSLTGRGTEIFNDVEPGGVGNGGEINIKAGSLILSERAQIEASVISGNPNQAVGRGNAGNVNIDVRGTVSLLGVGEETSDSNNTAIFNTLDNRSIGSGGNINIKANSVVLTDGGQLGTSTFGQGNAGNISIRALDGVSLDSGYISSLVGRGGVGNGGNIFINSGTLTLNNGALLQTSVENAFRNQPAGRGNAGNIKVDVRDTVTISDAGSGIFSTVGNRAIGNGGDINIKTGSLFVNNDGEINASSYGKGDAGNIFIEGRDRIFFDGGFALSTIGENAQGKGGDINITTNALDAKNGTNFVASTFGRGNAGSVIINATGNVLFDDAAAYSSVEAGAVGNGSNISIKTGTLTLKNGAQLQTLIAEASDTQSAGRGNAGQINIDVRDRVTISGADSGLSSYVDDGAIGNGGDINIKAGSLFLSDNADISASTFGQGNAGNITLRAADSVTLTNARIFSNVEAGAVGNSGNVDISAASFSLFDKAQLITVVREADGNFPAGQGNAGNVNVSVTGAVTISGIKNEFSSGIFSDVEAGVIGNGGNVTIFSGSLSLTDGAKLVASTSGTGRAGNIFLSALDSISFTNATVLSTVEPGGVGNGGNIEINAASLSLFDKAQLLTLVSRTDGNLPAGRGNAGNVNINVTGEVKVSNSKDGNISGIASQVQRGAIGNGGNITISSGSLLFNSGAYFSASTNGQGDAGSLFLNAKDSVSFLGDVRIFSTVDAEGIGKGGNINLNATSVTLQDNASLVSSTYGRGSAGDVIINAQENILFDRSNAFSTVEPGGIGNGGKIAIASENLTLNNGSRLETLVRQGDDNQPAGRGNAGSINVDVRDTVTISGVENDSRSGFRSFADIGTVGNGGNINIKTGSFIASNGAEIIASIFGKGSAGNIFIDARDRVSFADASGASSRVEKEGVGKGGDIRINTNSFSVINGAQLTTSTLGQGNAGNIQIQASENVNIAGSSTIDGFSSGLFSTTFASSTGKGGNITIDTNVFRVSNGAFLDARTRNDGRGGDITVNGNIVEALNGGQLLTTTSGSGRAGKITVNASDRVLLNGNDATFNQRLANFPEAVTNKDAGATSGFFVLSTGYAIAGDIEVNSPKVTLDNGGRFIAESASGDGGNINLNISNLLLMRRGSQISTSAGTAQQGGDGGNIDINSRFIVAVPEENSDISANAFTGAGGRVQITSRGVFGIEARSQVSDRTNDITASSERGVQGVTTINAPDNSGIQNSLNQLSENPIDPDALIASSCIARRNSPQSSTFFITGKGGLPERPGEAPISAFSTGTMQNVPKDGESAKPRPWKIGDPIVEPTGVYRLANGKRVLSRECD